MPECRCQAPAPKKVRIEEEDAADVGPAVELFQRGDALLSRSPAALGTLPIHDEPRVYVPMWTTGQRLAATADVLLSLLAPIQMPDNPPL